MSQNRKLLKKGVYETDKEKIGNLYNLRKEKGLTQDELCSALGITRTAYNSWENGSSKIKSDVLIMLADYYNVSIDYLLGRTACREIDNAYIREKTGLDENSIKTLSEWNSADDRRKRWCNYLNYFISHNKLKELFGHISELTGLAKIEGLATARKDYNITSQSIDDQTAQLWYISHIFTTILEDLTQTIRLKNYRKKNREKDY